MRDLEFALAPAVQVASIADCTAEDKSLFAGNETKQATRNALPAPCHHANGCAGPEIDRGNIFACRATANVARGAVTDRRQNSVILLQRVMNRRQRRLFYAQRVAHCR